MSLSLGLAGGRPISMKPYPLKLNNKKDKKYIKFHTVYCTYLRVCFFKKIQDWILKSERIRKWILRFFTTQINPRFFGSWCVKGTEESPSRVDPSVP